MLADYRRHLQHVVVPILLLVSLLPRASTAQARTVIDDNLSSGGAETIGFRLDGTLPDVASIGTSNAAGLLGSANVAPQFVVRAKRGGPVVRSIPSDSAPALSGLYYDTYLPVYGQLTDANGIEWYAVQLWGVLDGWIRADQTETGDPPSPTPIPESPPTATTPPGSVAPANPAVAFVAKGQTRDQYVLRQAADIQSSPIGLLQPGDSVSVQAWQADGDGSLWYNVRASAGVGWVWAGGVDLTTSSGQPRRTAGAPVALINGKGMWLPTPLLQMASPDAIVSAARSLGLTHIYLEAGDSNRGFYGRSQADRFLAVAHRSGIHVVGWVLTSLTDIPGDLNLCQTVAAYRAPSGDGFDGIAPDIESNMNADDVRAFSEILRADLGNQALIVGVIYPVGTNIAQSHPVAGILSRSMDALAPMAYWHDEQRLYDPAEIDSFIRGAVADAHNAVGDPAYPVEVIAQSYDGFSRNGAGPDSPTAAEVNTAIVAARDSGAYAVSLFQWGTTTPPEWNALRDLLWISRS